MQTCYNCGKSVSDETLICPDCGALVRRYTNTPPQTEQQPPQQNQQQPWQPQPQQLNGSQKVRFYGSVKVWLILLSIFCGHMAFCTLCTVALCLNTDYFLQALQMPGMEAYAELLNEFIDLLPQALPLFIALTVLFVTKLVCHIWLLRSGRRLPFRISIGVSLVALCTLAVLGGSLLSILCFFDPLFIWPSLKQFWPWMQK